MSEYDTFAEEHEDDSKLVKDLRAQIRDLAGKNKNLTSEVETFKTQARSSTVAEILSAKGINSKVAKLIPTDVEANEESVNKWLEEFGDVFGVQVQPAGDDGDEFEGADPNAVAQFARVQQTSRAGETDLPVGVAAQLKDLDEAADNATSLEDFYKRIGAR